LIPSVIHLIPMAVLLAIGWQSLVPLLDSVTLGKAVRGATKRGYGGYRRWGAIGFAVAAVVAGYLADWLEIGSLFPAYVACGLLVAAIAWGIPPQAAPPGDKSIELANVVALLRLPNFRSFLVFTLVGSVGGSACFTFRGIHLNDIGVLTSGIGKLMVLPIIAEVVCFTVARSLLRRFGTGPLLLAGRLMGTARWWFLSFVPYSPWLFLTEILHGTSFAVFYPAALRFVRSEVPARLRGTAQIIFFTCAMGIGSSIGVFLGGRVYDTFGMRPVLWIGGTILAIGGILQVALVKHLSPEDVQREADNESRVTSPE